MSRTSDHSEQRLAREGAHDWIGKGLAVGGNFDLHAAGKTVRCVSDAAGGNANEAQGCVPACDDRGHENHLAGSNRAEELRVHEADWPRQMRKNHRARHTDG